MANSLTKSRLRAALDKATHALMCQRGATGHWTGELSSSALSTATAVTALSLANRSKPNEDYHQRIERGLSWLASHANPDGGWGDTVKSLSNISTTTLVWAAFGSAPEEERKHAATVSRAEAWLAQRIGLASLAEPSSRSTLAQAIIKRYGNDRTFSVPILTMSALAGRLGTGREAWRHVIPLPFELAICPRRWFAALRLPVVSYALPALIAIGQAKFHFAPPRNPLVKGLRHLARSRALRVLETIQPPNGGFLEATPLTSFVTMSLIGVGLAGHPVAQKGLAFLVQSQREDGSWPIDTDLATWVTTLSINALASSGNSSGVSEWQRTELRSWLLDQQYRVRHPYTDAAPGGWAWTDLPGGVPDADDTAGAILALSHWNRSDQQTQEAAQRGLNWLLDLQNRDGGIPTFCRGWGKLPFDRSSADITAHGIRAWLAWRDHLPGTWRQRVERGLPRAITFLAKTQREDGSWVPLWFGNQFDRQDENPTYGTTRVMLTLAELARDKTLLEEMSQPMLRRATTWLLGMQNEDGGWPGAVGAPSTIEETAWGVEALAAQDSLDEKATDALRKGVTWLVGNVEDDQWTNPAPIGFYFAKLWYYERLYPQIFTVAALRRAVENHPNL